MVLAAILAFAASPARSRKSSKLRARQTTVAPKAENREDDVAVPLGGSATIPPPARRSVSTKGWRGLESCQNAQAARARHRGRSRGGEGHVRAATGKSRSRASSTQTRSTLRRSSSRSKATWPARRSLKTQVYPRPQRLLRRRARRTLGTQHRRSRSGGTSARAGSTAAEPGALDEPTYRSLAAGAGGVPALVQHTLTADDLKGPFVSVPDDMYEKERLDCLCYESLKEKLAERFHTTMEFLDQLNANVSFADLKAGDRDLGAEHPRGSSSRTARTSRGWWSRSAATRSTPSTPAGNLIFHAPTTLGSKYDPSPQRDRAGEEGRPRPALPLPADAVPRSPGQRAGSQPEPRARTHPSASSGLRSPNRTSASTARPTPTRSATRRLTAACG